MAEWRDSRYSENGGTCMEAAATWRKSSYSNNDGTCAEVATGIPRTIPVRDSKNPTGPHLHLTPTAFTAFVAAVKQDGPGAPLGTAR